MQKSEVSLIIYELLIFSATVAQLVEQLLRNQQVAGSSPASSSTKSPEIAMVSGLFLLPLGSGHGASIFVSCPHSAFHARLYILHK